MSNKAYLTYALDHEGDLVHVDKVPNGNECGCVCPHCKSPLCAKNGGDEEKMIHHFAHLSGADCVGAVESALHKMAKDILLETKCVYLPNRLDGRSGELHYFDRVEVEFYDKDTHLRPDSIGYNGNDSLWVEFKRTHAVDTKKKGKIISVHIDCIEIDLSGCQLDPVAVKDFLVNSSEKRLWIRDGSIKKRIVGRGSKGAYCDRFDDYNNGYYGYRPVKRTYAKDEKGQLVALQDDHFDMNEHSYYCLACGKELTIDVNENGTFYFTHIEDNEYCKDDLYLHEAAKEIVFDKFYHSDEFVISIPQNQSCAERTSCKFYNEEECCKSNSFPYDIKKHGYVECLKDFKFPNQKYKNDLIFKRSDSLKDAIILSVDACNICVDTINTDNRIIEIRIDSDYSLDILRTEPLGIRRSLFINFRKNKEGNVPRTEINRRIQKFQLYSSGKYYLDIITCSELNIRKPSTEYVIVYASRTIDLYDAIIYALNKCFNLKKKACYCELCFFLTKVNSNGLTEKICKRYRTKGTPHYPLKAGVQDCPHFSLNRGLIEKIKNEYADLETIDIEMKTL